MKRKGKLIDEYILKLLEENGMENDDLIKHLIIWKSFSKEIKPSLSKMNLNEMKLFASKFILFVIQFETVCMRAYKSGSGSTASAIISIYSAKDLHVESSVANARLK